MNCLLKKKAFIQKVEQMTDAQIEKLEQILTLVEKTELEVLKGGIIYEG